MEKIALAEILVGLRRELEEAKRQAADENLKFKVEDIELELRVGATATGGVKGGVKFWVYNAEAKGEISSAATQTLRLKLTPVVENDGDLLVADEDEK